MNEYEVGDNVIYQNNPENRWEVLSIEVGVNNVWIRAGKIGTKSGGQYQVQKVFPYGVFTLESKKMPKVVTTIAMPEHKPRKPKKILDDISQLLAEARDTDEMWDLAKMAGVDINKAKDRIGHLSNGLQRMGIGNRLRVLYKKGEFNPEDIIWDVDNGFMFIDDLPRDD